MYTPKSFINATADQLYSLQISQWAADHFNDRWSCPFCASVSPTCIPASMLSQFCTLCILYIVCVSVRSRWIVSDRQYFTIRLALLMIYLLTSSSLPGANQWKYFCLFTQCPNSSFQIHFWLFDSDSDSDSDLVFTCVRTFHTLCGLGSARYCFRVNNWTINWNVCAESEMKLKEKQFGEKTEKNRKTRNV